MSWEFWVESFFRSKIWFCRNNYYFFMQSLLSIFEFNSNWFRIMIRFWVDNLILNLKFDFEPKNRFESKIRFWVTKSLFWVKIWIFLGKFQIWVIRVECFFLTFGSFDLNLNPQLPFPLKSTDYYFLALSRWIKGPKNQDFSVFSNF